MNSNNPRITNFISTTKDENNAQRIITQIKQMESPSLHYVLCKYIQCSIIRQQPDFLQILFKDHLNIIMQMIEWMLVPKYIAKKRKIKSNLDFFPYRCKEFIKDNIIFYEKLYIYARSNQLPMKVWFNFLRKQYYDKQTIQTALGYFGQVMIPFAKYQFTINNYNQTNELVAQSERQQKINIMKILPKQLIEQLVNYSHFQQIFQFLKTAVLVSIQDPIDYEISKMTLLKILLKSQIPNIFIKVSNNLNTNAEDNSNKLDLLQYVALCLKQLIVNLELVNNKQLRIQYFINVFIQSKTIPYVVDQILLSKLCTYSLYEQSSAKTSNISLSSSQEYPPQTILQNLNTLTLSHGGSMTTKNSNLLYDNEQEDLMEIMLKILSYSVEIFTKLPKFFPQPDQKKENQQIVGIDSIAIGKKKKFINIFRQQLQYMLNNLYTMTRIVYGEGESSSKSIPFSSGQKIKPISFMKFQFLNLINNSLLLIRAKDLPTEVHQKSFQKSSFPKKLGSISYSTFELNFQKLNLIPIIQKYLNENRWNNIAHHVIEKICHSLILCGYDYLKKNVQKDKKNKLTQSFLAFLVQSFTQRDYIFLSTLKFTSQGNLQSIYNISRDLAHTLNNTNKLVVLLNQFEPWNKFIMNDLKLYEQKAYRKGVNPNDEDYQQSETFLKVDEADTIKRLVQNISQTIKWPTKIVRSKGNSKSGIFEGTPRIDYDNQINQPQNMTKSTGFYFRNKKQNLKKKVLGLDDLYSKKVEESIQYVNQQQFQQLVNISDLQIKQKMTKSDIKSSEKEVQRQLHEVFKNYATNKSNKLQRKGSQNSI